MIARWSQNYLFTLKEAPSDADILSQKLLVRAGFVKKLAPGIFTYGNFALRAIRKFEAIIREEHNKAGCIEILMPMVQPREIWDETNRWKEMGDGLLKFQNRNQHWFCLGATHEEAITDYIRHDLKSYRDLPKNIYQIQTKYRDEVRPRFGLMRGREFIMKDAYSFDVDSDSAKKTYEVMYQVYKNIFDRLGLNYRIVQADAGNIGGSQTHEFQLLADAGEDALLVGDQSDFAANIEICPAIDADLKWEPSENFQLALEKLKAAKSESPKSLEKFSTPNQKTIADLEKFTETPANQLVKTLFFSANDGSDPKNKDLKAIAVLLRGSDELNPIKLKNALKLSQEPLMLTDEEVKSVTGAYPGSCGPVGLKIPIYADYGVMRLSNIIVGANEDDYHFKNVNQGRDFQISNVFDLRFAKEGDRCPSGKGFLKAYRGVELGHVFYLGTKYSNKMKAHYLDKQGKAQPIEMGCYGIGVSRTIQACIEQKHDVDGIIWPKAIAPFDVHICLLDPKDEQSQKLAQDLSQQLLLQNLESFIDDRDERPGIKFKDADLIGLPVRVVIGKKGIESDQLDVVVRSTKESLKVSAKSLVEIVANCYKKN